MAVVRTMALARVSPRIIGIAWHRDRYRLPAAESFVRLAQRETARELRLLSATLTLPS